jgi:hypothetical protein
MQKEIFKDIPNYEGIYQVSNFGNVKSLNYGRTGNEKILKPSITNGYYYINLFKDKKYKHKYIHQLVAITFLNHIPCGYKLVVDHKDNNRLNNRLENLQLISNRENISKDKKGGTSNYLGVCWDKIANKWKSCIKIDNKNKHLGYFKTELEAHDVYKNALEMYNNGDLSFMESKKSSQYKGVYWDNTKKRWKSSIYIDKKKNNLGTFKTEYEAHLAYQKALESLK